MKNAKKGQASEIKNVPREDNDYKSKRRRKVSNYEKAKQVFELIQEEKKQQREQEDLARQKRQEAMESYLSTNKKMNRAIKKRNKKGQPDLGAQVEVNFVLHHLDFGKIYLVHHTMSGLGPKPFLRKGSGMKTKINYPVLRRSSSKPFDNEAQYIDPDLKHICLVTESTGHFEKVEREIADMHRSAEEDGLSAAEYQSTNGTSSEGGDSKMSLTTRMNRQEAQRMEQWAAKGNSTPSDVTPSNLSTPLGSSTPHGRQWGNEEPAIISGTSNKYSSFPSRLNFGSSESSHSEERRLIAPNQAPLAENFKSIFETQQSPRPIRPSQSTRRFISSIPAERVGRDLGVQKNVETAHPPVMPEIDNNRRRSIRYSDVEQKLAMQLRDAIAHLDYADSQLQRKAKEITLVFEKFLKDKAAFEVDKERLERSKKQLEREKKLLVKNGTNKENSLKEQLDDAMKTISDRDRQLTGMRVKMRKLEERNEKVEKELENSNNKTEKLQKNVLNLQVSLSEIPFNASFRIISSINTLIYYTNLFLAPTSVCSRKFSQANATHGCRSPSRPDEKWKSRWTKVTTTECNCEVYEYSNGDIRWLSPDRTVEINYYGSYGASMIDLGEGKLIRYFNIGQVCFMLIYSTICLFKKIRIFKVDLQLMFRLRFGVHQERYLGLTLFRKTGLKQCCNLMGRFLSKFHDTPVNSSFRGHPSDRHVINHTYVEPEWLEPQYKLRRFADRSMKLKLRNLTVCFMGDQDIGYINHITIVDDQQHKQFCVRWGRDMREKQRQIEAAKIAALTAMNNTPLL
uniref:Uncharacterized protein n=1 Tax=Heterorhabditis bacteriophora TaxID=37862 RepID=A0A1I7XTR2_HETBA